MSALFRWPCSISIHLSPRCVTAGVRPFPQAMQHFYSFVSQVCHCWCPPLSLGHVAFLFMCFPGLSLVVSPLFRWPCSTSILLFICFPGLSLLVSTLFRWPCSFLFICFPGLSLVLPPFSAGHVAFLFICLPCDFCLFVFQVWCLYCCFLPRDCLRECIPATLCNSLSFVFLFGQAFHELPDWIL